MPPKNLGSVKEWLKHADSDLAIARALQGRKDILAAQVCFHAQQSAEKALKAFFIARDMTFNFTHDIDELLDLLEQNHIDSSELSDVSALTPYAAETRYPGTADSVQDSDIQRAILLAEKALIWAKKAIGEVSNA